jgi:predicted MFS family arabinose efflux permease
VSLSVQAGEQAGESDGAGRPQAATGTRALNLDKGDERRVVVVMSLAYALLACSLSAQVALPEIRRTIHMTDVVTSLHGSFFGWAMLVGGLFGSRLIGRFGRSRLLATGAVGLGSGAVLFGTGHVVAQTLAGAAISGISGAMLVITIPGLIADAFGARRSMVFNRLNVVPAFVGLLFPLAVAAAPSVSLTCRWPTIILPLVFLVAAAVVGVSLRSDGRSVPSADAGDGVKAVVDMLRVAGVRRRFLIQILSVTIEFGFAVWVVTYLREVVGFSRDRAPLGAAAWALGMFISRALIGRVVHAFGPRLEASCFAGVMAGVVLLVFGHWPLLRFLAVPLVSLSIAPSYTLGVERLFLRGEATPANTATLSSLAAIASGVAITIGPLLVGLAGDAFGLRRAMLALFVGAAVGFGLSVTRWGGEAGRLGCA